MRKTTPSAIDDYHLSTPARRVHRKRAPQTWKGWKADYDGLMAHRKTIKGKPDAEQKAILTMNKAFIDFYETVLWHSGELDCTCRRCAMLRQQRRNNFRTFDKNPLFY